MYFEFDKTSWPSVEEGEKNCYLLTNGLGGFSSLSIIGSVARGDVALLMAAKKAPNVRWNIITNVLEEVIVDGISYVLTSQNMNGISDDFTGYKYLKKFKMDVVPTWEYEVEGIEIIKTITMVSKENTIGIKYSIINPQDKQVVLKVSPMFRDTPKSDVFDENRSFDFIYDNNTVLFDKTKIVILSNGLLQKNEPKILGPFFFSQDERDGRNSKGFVLTGPQYIYETNKDQSFELLMSLDLKYDNEEINVSKLIENEMLRAELIKNQAGLKSELANALLLASDAYLVNRDSINGKSIIAGYSFFEDWGRDTMISLPGICLTSKRFLECKQILQTFAKYEKEGLLPNLFPEGDENPMYNSVDAPLLFINTVYEYVKASGDNSFIEEIYPVMEEIIEYYKKGTKFHICMDDDYLIKAGEDLEQLTWMDVRVNGFLPTPRHGKPVEINAYWYSACKIMEEFSLDASKKALYKDLSEKIKESFLNKFWNSDVDCLKDVLSGDYQEKQIRPNQVWALTMPFTMLSLEQEKKVLDIIRKELYTTVGLRTLSPKDENFHPIYIGDMEQRDRAYHQGTVWTFPLGAYYRACIKLLRKQPDEELKEHINTGMQELKKWLEEGCIGQLAEIYDGLTPTISRGCFAQAWSVGELLRAVDEFDNL